MMYAKSFHSTVGVALRSLLFLTSRLLGHRPVAAAGLSEEPADVEASDVANMRKSRLLRGTIRIVWNVIYNYICKYLHMHM